MRKVSIVGIHSLPANYGGFETLSEYLVEHLGTDFDLTVFCSARRSAERNKSYKKAKLVYMPFDASGWQSIIYDIISILKAVRTSDKILILGASGGIILPLLKKYREKFILNIGGLEWERSKWSYPVRKYLKFSERTAIISCRDIISDNRGIQEYIVKTYNRTSNLIYYGGNHVTKVEAGISDRRKYPFLDNDYVISVARIQSDNNIEMILDAFKSISYLPLVFVGNWKNSRYGKAVKLKYSNIQNIILLDPVYDKRELDLLRSNCKIYVHGHSAGGTNPALVEAMSLGLPVIAYHSIFNYYTTMGEALYFKSADELKSIIEKSDTILMEQTAQSMKRIARENYLWECVSDAYSKIFNQD